MVEKVIRALFLLEGLSESGMSFIFKGGTAVMLLQGIPKRFSIDIDIVVPKTINFEVYFNKFASQKHFTRYELQYRTASSSIEKLHYKFFYKPVNQSNLDEDNILLDILIESNKYEKIFPVDINSPFGKQDGLSIQVNIPGVEDILGDKLTAFAPNTTGIPYEKNSIKMGMEIIKQLYDIGNLFETAKEISTVSKTFRKIAETEMKYRNINDSVENVLNDIVQTAFCISTRGVSGKGNFTDLQSGISKLKAYIFSEPYSIEKAIIHSSRAAYLAKLIMLNKTEIIRFNDPMQIKDWIIDDPEMNKLNKLKKTNPEAFFYWYQVYDWN
ncbi:MAG TPA: nucleotidyl transferase AbiEii/AbiGii toxin family protein [Clostridiales bacterium]|nr:nucleotidyl transferase AbiEii/AbiGii toxin family protein [Clostridiales bacterium]HQP70758.1 nucleotidyl transferase AbiEii/AbiGii toxin family protein [Clostridiales bacterium]